MTALLCVEVHEQLRAVADRQAQRMKAELYKLARENRQSLQQRETGEGTQCELRRFTDIGSLIAVVPKEDVTPGPSPVALRENAGSLRRALTSCGWARRRG